MSSSSITFLGSLNKTLSYLVSLVQASWRLLAALGLLLFGGAEQRGEDQSREDKELLGGEYQQPVGDIAKE